jgi:hypothetical protein
MWFLVALLGPLEMDDFENASICASEVLFALLNEEDRESEMSFRLKQKVDGTAKTATN